MGGAPPEHPWPAAGPSGENEKQAAEDTDMGPAPPEYDGEDPPTPPEEIPHDPFEKLPDRSRDPPGDSDSDHEGPPHPHPGHGHGGRGWHGHHGHHGPPGAWPGAGPHSHHHGPPPCGPRGRGPFGRGGFGRGGFGRGGHGHHPWGPPPPHGGPGSFPFGGGWGFGGPRGGFGGGWGGPDSRAQARFMKKARKFAERFGVDPSVLAGAFGGAADTEDGVDFEPALDLYDTPGAYVVHLALPGATKQDVGVTWDEAAATLTVAGVVTRGVDEAMHTQLALGERPVGVFKRRVRLGDGTHPARVDADDIQARMEEGVLKIRVAKVEEFVEVKKVEVS